MAFTLPPLPWAKDALKPHISPETIDFHYGKHHQAYVTKLNGLLQNTPDASKTLEDLVKTKDGAVFNNAAQVWNHTFYWNGLKPNGGAPTGKVAELINRDFGSYDKFKEDFLNNCIGHFGSGWVWLLLDSAGKLKIHQTHDAGNPIRDQAGSPLLTCDVWEHAYYVDYRNDRGSYVKSWFNLINWDFVNKNIETSKL